MQLSPCPQSTLFVGSTQLLGISAPCHQCCSLFLLHLLNLFLFTLSMANYSPIGLRKKSMTLNLPCRSKVINQLKVWWPVEKKISLTLLPISSCLLTSSECWKRLILLHVLFNDHSLPIPLSTKLLQSGICFYISSTNKGTMEGWERVRNNIK